MIHLTQLIYIKAGQEEIFNEFEAIAIPLMAKYNGKMILRVRPTEDTIVESSTEIPYEIHYMSFGSDQDLQNFLKDEDRKQSTHLKDASIRTTILLKGEVV